VLSGNQGFYAGLWFAALVSALIVMPVETLLVLHILLSLIYFASLGLRFAAFTRQQFAGPGPAALQPPKDGLPCYTVMVALYREAAVAEQPIASLVRLDWPPSLLDIKLVCEADDQETIAALKALKPARYFEIVEVPLAAPRTKPKALTYALAAARGEFLAVYDAEDRPHPQQLREAHARFRASPPELACLQAPLIITNARDSWISALFSLEYSGLFRGLLPMLARREMPLPLGGTSNHFRTDALRKAGGWDPFNVTEDADLGFRLDRLGTVSLIGAVNPDVTMRAERVGASRHGIPGRYHLNPAPLCKNICLNGCGYERFASYRARTTMEERSLTRLLRG